MIDVNYTKKFKYLKTLIFLCRGLIIFMPFNKQHIPWNKGLTKETDERVAKYAKTLTGKTRPPEVVQKIAESIKRNHKRKGIPRSEETKKKISNTKQNMSLERKEKIRESHRGKNNGRWLGGISFEPYCPKFNEELKERIRSYFEFKCMLCGKEEELDGRKLSCHHVEYNKNACCDGKLVQFAALCQTYHNKTTHGDRERWENMLHIIICEIYNNRSYYTKEEWKIIKELDM